MSEEVHCTSYLQSERLTRSQTKKGGGRQEEKPNLTAKKKYKEEGETETARYTQGKEERGREIWGEKQFHH